ncbi:MAG: PhoH family protein, partial [Bdellovibrionales bacterium]
MTDTQSIEFTDNTALPALFGPQNANLAYLEKTLNIAITQRGNTLSLSGPQDALAQADTVLKALLFRVQKGQDAGKAQIDAELRFMNSNTDISAKTGDKIVISTKKKSISARSPNQNHYLKMIADHPMVFGLGPAGTGKTYLAV